MKMDQDFIDIASYNFMHLLGYFEKLTKQEYLNRFKQMYSLASDADDRLKWFYEAASKAPFTAIERKPNRILFYY
jgi:hypothetical protein